jgi:hypothetical protein
MPKSDTEPEEKLPKITKIKISPCKNKDYMYSVKIGSTFIDELGHTGTDYS